MKNIFYRFVKPISKDEDQARKEFILDILLVASIILLALAFFISLFKLAFADSTAYANDALSLRIIFAILLLFFSLYFFSRKGKISASAYIFIGIYFALASFMAYNWGIELPTGILFFILVIVMSGILISARFAFFISLFSILIIFTLNFFQKRGITHPNLYWKQESWGASDITVLTILFLIIATVSWLSNREIEKSLIRARKSEAELKKERDFLEVKVEERTKELREAQIEKMAHLSRFAEFGRLSSGLFHDLMNPLTAVSLNMEKIKSARRDDEGVAKAKTHLEKAVEATRKMEEFISAVRKQMSNQENRTYFSLADEINQIIRILSHKALKAKVGISFSASHHIKTYGDSVKFSQVAANLLSNAIDAYEGVDKCSGGERLKEVAVKLTEENGMIILSVEDNGKGIPKECVNKIFDPFFTTKGFHMGIGIGLSLTKSIIEKDFHGNVEIESAEGKGAKFIIKFPKWKQGN